MADPYKLPSRVEPDANTLPKRADLEKITYFVLGNKGDDNTPSDKKNQGWVGSEGSPFSIVSPSVARIRSAFAPMNINRSNNSWHGQNEYAIQTGTFSPWRHWENCAEHHPEKDALGRRGMFDLYRQRSSEFKSWESTSYYGGGIGACGAGGPVTSINYSHPDNIHESWSPALSALGDKDKSIALHKAGWSSDRGLVHIARSVGGFDGEAEAFQTATIMRNTGFSVRQSRDMIDQQARLRVAKALEPKANPARHTELANNLPKTAETAAQLKEAQGEYRAFLVNFKEQMKLTHHIGNDIKALEAFVTGQVQGSIAHEVASQILSEYKTVQTTLAKARDVVVAEGDHKGKKYSEFPEYAYLNAETLDSRTLAKLHGDSNTQNAFFNKVGSAMVNTGWLWTVEYSGLDKTTLATVLDPTTPEVGNNLSQALRFIGQQRERHFTQALFDPEKAGSSRDFMKIEMVDLQKMTQALLNPQSADLPEQAHLLAAAYQAQFVTPTDKHARLQYGVYRLCTAFDTGTNIVTTKQTQQVVEALKTGTYDNSFSYMGITQSDFNGILSLLVKEGEKSLNGSQADKLDQFFKQLAEKHGKDGYISKDTLFMASAPIKIKILEGAQVSYSLLDGNGNDVTIGSPIRKDTAPNAYNAAYQQAAQYNTLNQGFNRFIQELALAPEQHPNNTLYCGVSSPSPWPATTTIFSFNTDASPLSAGLVMPQVAPELVRVSASSRPNRPNLTALNSVHSLVTPS